MSQTFRDGTQSLVISPEPDGRVAVEVFDGELPLARMTFNAATAEGGIAFAITEAVKGLR
ncbi:hypothetical protein [Nocardia thailandica]|uniref:hypothetical protein n=1 Tax=Nocardia thailandica TaxID=257275 RepID=UPI0002DC3FE2|nr:hypothetical protein [Nocardia thailandica]